MPSLPDLQNLYPLFVIFVILLVGGKMLGLGMGVNFDGAGGSWVAGFMTYGVVSLIARMYVDSYLGTLGIPIHQNQLIGAWILGALTFIFLEMGGGALIPFLGGFLAKPNFLMSAIMGALVSLLWQLWPHISDIVLYHIQAVIRWPWF